MKHYQKELYIRDMVWGGVWGALALFLPILFHPFGLGSHLMPMFLPLLIVGCTLHLRTGLILSVSIPLISSIFTGMPPLYPPIAILMILEASAMNLWLFWAYRKNRWNIFFALIVAFLIQRGVRIIFILIAQKFISLPGFWLLIPALLWGLPGAVIQTALIPWIIKKIKEQSGAVGRVETAEPSDTSDTSDLSETSETAGTIEPAGTVTPPGTFE
jgi:hypothetical protein